MEHEQDQREQDQDGLIDWPRYGQQSERGEPAERFRDATVAGHELGRADGSGDEQQRGSHAGRLGRPLP